MGDGENDCCCPEILIKLETINDFVKEKYERTAHEYSQKEMRGYWLIYNLEKLRNFLDTHPIQQVVDIGCGSGALIRSLAPDYPGIRFLGIDFSEKLIEIARSLAKADNLKFTRKDIVEYQYRIAEELNLKNQKVLMLLMGPFEHYHRQDPFAKAVRRIFADISQGAMIVTYHNNDMWLRGLVKGKGKKYWNEEDSLSFWTLDAKLIQSEYFHFLIFDFLISVLQWSWFHGFFLFLEKGLRAFPKGIQKKFFVAFFHVFQKDCKASHV
jgi:2-polyprenyl-3-methyl-5-hydroxy-6-metoxy-1,4-benzoquinol methylase